MTTSASHADLQPPLALELNQGPDGVRVRALQTAGRQWCFDTRCWRETLLLLLVPAYGSELALTHNHDATALRLGEVRLNGRALRPEATTRSPCSTTT